MSVTAATIAGIFLLGLPFLLIALHPVLRGKRGSLAVDTTDAEINELLEERERSYTALTDLDFDFECGKISEPDYLSLRTALMQETAEVLSRIDARITNKRRQADARAPQSAPTAHPSPVNEDLIEREIARYKQRQKRSDS